MKKNICQFKLTGTPNNKQRLFFLSSKRHTAYGGARGGGKSWALRRKFVLLALNYPKLKLLLLRRTFPELRENHILVLQEELHTIARFVERDKSFIFLNKSKIKLGYCEHESDVFQYQGQEYDVIGLEEATHFTDSQRLFLSTCNRTTRTDFVPRMYYTANPGGVGHAWFKRLFVDRSFLDNENPQNYSFIKANIYDNQILMNSNPQYLEQLQSLPREMKKAYLYGDWNVFAGQFFKEFNPQKHICLPFKIPGSWKKFRSLDYGLDMTCCHWWALSPHGVAYIYRELYQPGLTLSEAARKITQNTPQDEAIMYTAASPDLWNSRQESSRSGKEIMCSSGLTGLVKANNSRVTGWRLLRDMLSSNTICFFECCSNIIRTLPLLQFHEVKTEDTRDYPHEYTHAPESIRYGAMSLPPSFASPSHETSSFFTKTEYEELKSNAFSIRKA